MAKGKPPAAPFQKGHPGGPGRPKGSKNKLGEAFIAALCADFTQHGDKAVVEVRQNDPAAYLRVIASILPKELEIKRPLADLTEDELANAIELIRATIAASPEGVGTGIPFAEGGDTAEGLPPLH